MEIRVFNEHKIPVTIRYRDVENVKMIDRRICYFTTHGTYYGAASLKEQALLHENQGMFQIDKNSVINVNHIQHIVKGVAYIRGKKYPVSRRKRAAIARYLKKSKKTYQ